MIAPKGDILFEVSWEVCNKVGGIYTVVKSKADLINNAYKEYYLIGPYIKKEAREAFTEKEPPEFLRDIFDGLSKAGIKCYFGEWLIKGKPKIILIDISNYTYKVNDYKKWYWDNFKIDSLNAGWTFEEPMLWSTAAGMIIEKTADCKKDKKCVAHCHEWMAGFALLYLKAKNCCVGTVFTTHATMLGRTICAVGRPLYDELDKINPTEEAYKYSIQDKYLTELACAQNADIFTTVSEITSIETTKILGRKADVLLLNGLDMEKFPSFEELSVKHRMFREKIREFVAYYFFPYYYFDLSQTLLFFIVGRYEFKNKGIDIFIKALGKLNEMMKRGNTKKTAVVFFWIPKEVHGAKLELSTNKLNHHQFKDLIEENEVEIKTKILNHLMQCKTEEFDDPEHFQSEQLFSEEFLLEARTLKLNFAKAGKPMICTHNLPNENDDEIIKNLIAEGLDNNPDDRVKVIFYPVYLTGVDGLIDLPYYDAIMGCHLGIFPSYYEPWGYTPLESAALGVTSLTTDMGGFGRFLLSKNLTHGGVYVLKRLNKKPEESIDHFAKILYNYTLFNEKDRVEQKILAKNVANKADWNEFVNFYFQAHNLALERIQK